jgi:hypothetical protein
MPSDLFFTPKECSMKTFLFALAALGFTNSAFANTFFSQCSAEDLTFIREGLKSAETDAKPSVLKSLNQALQRDKLDCQREIWITREDDERYDARNYIIRADWTYSIAITFDKLEKRFVGASVDN